MILDRFFPNGEADLRALGYQLGPGTWYQPAYRRVAGSLEITRGALLEVGCGPGWVSIHAAAGNPELDCVAIDTSPAMLRLAEKNKHHRLNVTFREMDAAEIKYAAGTFDRIVAVQTMHHWTAPEAVVAELRRVIRPDGWGALFDVDPTSEILPEWIERKGVWPTEGWLRRNWRRYSLGPERLQSMIELLRGSFGRVELDHLGIYNRIRVWP